MRYKPFNLEERSDLELTKKKLGLQALEKQETVYKYKLAMVDIDQQIDSGVKAAKIKLQAANMEYELAKFDKAHKLTITRTEIAALEADKEMDRLKRNVEAMEKQIQQGKPIMDPQPEVETKKEDDKIDTRKS